MNNRARACVYLNDALEIGEKDNYFRAFVDEAPEIQNIFVAQFNWSASNDYLQRIQAAFDLVLTKKQPINEYQEMDFSIASQLKPIEIAILSALSRIMIHRKIASEMHYSYTIQSYIKAIYSKPGSHSRQEAVNMAKALGLLEKPLFAYCQCVDLTPS